MELKNARYHEVHILPDLTPLQVTQFQTYAISNEVKKNMKQHFFKHTTDISLR